MCGVSRDCGFTQELAMIINKKFSEYEKEVFLRWLQIVEDERNNKIHRAKKFY